MSSGMAKKVLIVENEFVLRDALTDLFVSNAFQVTSCTVAKCLAVLRQSLPDVIILGVPHRQQEKELKKLVAFIKQLGVKPIPILVTSTDRTVKKVAQSIGGNDYLEEPFNVDTLLEKVTLLCKTSVS